MTIDHNKNILSQIKHTGLFSEMDLHFARFIARFSPDWNTDIFMAAALVSRATADGNICLELEAVAEPALLENRDMPDKLNLPSPTQWRQTLFSSPAVGRPGDKRPLILDDRNRLYLYRYWDYEKKLAHTIKERIKGELQGINLGELRTSIQQLFPEAENGKINWQKIAATVAVLKRFSVITGGPGSGKTFTIAGILALLLASARDTTPKILLAAPTGKAAARLAESIKQARQYLACSDAIKYGIPDNVYTIHRLLKPVVGTPYFRHHVDNPLPADIVVIDEASMVDLALMSKLVAAVTPDGRLLLVGDKDQLASVEAGSVLGDICDRQIIHGFSKRFLKKIEKLTRTKVADSTPLSEDQPGLQDCITVLQKSYRFSAHGGIGGLSRTINLGDANASLALINAPSETSISFHDIRSRRMLMHELTRMIVDGYRKYLTCQDPGCAMDEFSRFKILCALKKGPFGVTAINRLAEQVLGDEGLIPRAQPLNRPWYHGRPVLITRNDYNLNLFNGDIGITLPDPDASDDELQVYFPGTAGEFRRFPIHALSDHETVYAMTVHKSQGSEFDHVALILPDKDYPLLTRELIYTGLTRARQTVSVWGTESVLRTAIVRKIERTSGLREALWT
ncbi:MAG: exodeoxyribonuclease V subunit alpha [Desulfobacterales bacterium]|jgi:exodeoxyribonuclease V alpha subunit